MPQGHDRSLTRWVRAWGLKLQGQTPPLGDTIVPVVIVDDATNVAVPLPSPAGAADCTVPAVAAVFGIIEFTPPPGGAILQWHTTNATIGHNIWIKAGFGTQITANLQTINSVVPGSEIEAGVAVLGPRAELRLGTATADPDATFGPEGGNWVREDAPMPPIYLPGDQDLMAYIAISLANQTVAANVQWSEFGPV